MRQITFPLISLVDSDVHSLLPLCRLCNNTPGIIEEL